LEGLLVSRRVMQELSVGVRRVLQAPVFPKAIDQAHHLAIDDFMSGDGDRLVGAGPLLDAEVGIALDRLPPAGLQGRLGDDHRWGDLPLSSNGLGGVNHPGKKCINVLDAGDHPSVSRLLWYHMAAS
jgi:hypothetical protein